MTDEVRFYNPFDTPEKPPDTSSTEEVYVIYSTDFPKVVGVFTSLPDALKELEQLNMGSNAYEYGCISAPFFPGAG